jgi:hypothetical protein
MSAWGPIPHCPIVVTAEGLGLLYGLRAALPLYAGPIQVESDNSFLVNEVKRNESSKSLIARHQNHHDFVPKLSCVQNKQEGELCCRWSGKRRA